MMTPKEIEQSRIYTEMGMTDAEFGLVKDILGRLPNYTELGLFSVMWSEHCSYKNSKVLLRKFPTKGPRVLQGPGEGAGIVDIGDSLAAVFKLESHNHPSAIEPYEGAATGVGGIVRDVFSMGATPVAMLGSFRFGEVDTKRTKYLIEKVVEGSADYANRLGVPTVGGDMEFESCYAQNPLVNVMCVGLIRHEDMKKGVAQGVGNSVMYVGAPTGRDGIHGATFASTELAEDAEEKRPDVQAGDPFVEKMLMEACLSVMKHPAIVGIQDMGAAGLISSSSEMASKAGTGIELYLDHVPQRDKDMSAYEMMLSESQERMLLVVEQGREEEVQGLFAKFNLQAVVVGKVTDDKMVRLFHKGEIAAEVPADALAESAPEYHKPQSEPAYYKENLAITAQPREITDYKETLREMLTQPAMASKRDLSSQYDYMAQTNTISAWQNAAVLRVEGTNKALAMTTACNGRFVYLNPFVGGKIAMAEAARHIVATGALPIAVTDNLNFGSPENPEIFWQMDQSVMGIAEACTAFDAPVIGGNVSLYNERSGGAIYPTPTIGMVGLIEDLTSATSPNFDTADAAIYLLGESKAEFGGSELQKLQEDCKTFGQVPAVDLTLEKKQQDLVRTAIQQGLVSSARAVTKGGVLVTLAQGLMSGTSQGASIDVQADDVTTFLFSETQARYLLCVLPEHQAAFEDLTAAMKIGHTTKDDTLKISVNGNTVLTDSVSDLKRAWEGAFACLLKAEG